MDLAGLNRALLARQGLLEPLPDGVVAAVEALGALQAQHWPAVPVALASRVRGFAVGDLRRALAGGSLVTGTLIRTTLHVVSAREHPAYAAVAGAVASWRRSNAAGEGDELLEALVAFARRAPRTVAEIGAHAEEWIAARPNALHPDELAAQRERSWRAVTRWPGFVRVPADGVWGAKAPSSLLAAPAEARSELARALDEVVRRHLRGFGPAGPEDVASWLNWRLAPVREAFARLAGSLEELEGPDGKPLYDLPQAPRPDASVEAPPRLLAPFDSALLAYAPKRRARLVPDEHRDAIYERKNLRVLPTYLIDGRVAGTWSSEVRRGEATLTLTPLQKLPRGPKAALVHEAERVLRIVAPEAKAHRAVVAARRP